MKETKFNKWFDTFIAKKGINRDGILEIKGGGKTDYISIKAIIYRIKLAPLQMKISIKNKLAMLDLSNSNIEDFFKYIAETMVI